ncbi:flagellar hook-basal body complex protein FliE [Thermocrinis sp.]
MEIGGLNPLFNPQMEKLKGKNSGFTAEFQKFLHWVNEEQKKAEAIKDAVLKGADIPLHQMIVEFEKASIALNLLLQIRNKLIEAFQEINRMQV